MTWLTDWFRWKKKEFYKRRESKRLASFEDMTTQQRKLEELIAEHAVSNPKYSELLMHMHDKGWKAVDALYLSFVFEKTLFPKVDGLEVPSEALDLLHEAIEKDAFDPNVPPTQTTRKSRLELAVETLGKAIALNAPVSVYTDVWSKWLPGDGYTGSLKFAEDMDISLPALEHIDRLTKKARSFFLHKVDDLAKSNCRVYGEKVRDICNGLYHADAKTPPAAFSLCHKFSSKDTLDEIPKMYGYIMKLPSTTPPKIFSFLDYAMGFIKQGVSGINNKSYAEELSKLVYRISILLKGDGGKKYSSADLSGIFAARFTEDHAERYINGYNELLKVLMDSESRGAIQVRIDDVKKLLPKFQDAVFDANLCILDCSEKLKEISDREAKYFEILINPLRDLPGRYSSLDLIVFADAHLKKRKGDKLTPFEERLYEDMVTYSYKQNTKIRDDRNKLIKRIKTSRMHELRVPLHVVKFYQDMYDIKVYPYMIDIGEDNDAWYRWSESADSYMNLNDEADAEQRIDKELMKAISNRLMDRNLLHDRKVALAGLACGDALPELVLSEEIKKKYSVSNGTPLDVWLCLYDINDTMLHRAARNCNSNMLLASLKRKDIRKLNYDDFAAIQRQLIITMFGRTYFNLETGSDSLIDSLVDICVQHHDKEKRDAMILIEGVKQNNMKYYWDRKAEDMHVNYMLRRLEIDKDVICYDRTSTQRIPRTPFGNDAYSTYAALRPETKDKVEFYFVALRPAPILGGKMELKRHQIVRCGESRILSKALLRSFRNKGLNFDLIQKGKDDNTLMVLLTPDYERLKKG